MRRIGIIGGLGPEATIEYYRRITSVCRERQGNGGYPEIIIYSLNLERCMHMAETTKWGAMAEWLLAAVRSLHQAGADFAIIAAGTPHVIFDEVKVASPIPMLSIVEETLAVSQRLGLNRVGLLGTLFTMQSTFFQEVYSKRNIQVVVPEADDQQYIHDKLRTEIALGRLIEKTRQSLLSIVKRMKDRQSIQGVILGCTELPLILTKDELGIPFLDTMRIHADAAVEYCLSNEKLCE